MERKHRKKLAQFWAILDGLSDNSLKIQNSSEDEKKASLDRIRKRIFLGNEHIKCFFG